MPDSTILAPSSDYYPSMFTIQVLAAANMPRPLKRQTRQEGGSGGSYARGWEPREECTLKALVALGAEPREPLEPREPPEPREPCQEFIGI
jgi:hypothetical protein